MSATSSDRQDSDGTSGSEYVPSPGSEDEESPDEMAVAADGLIPTVIPSNQIARKRNPRKRQPTSPISPPSAKTPARRPAGTQVSSPARGPARGRARTTPAKGRESDSGGWVSWNRSRDKLWSQKLSLLREYVTQNGRLPVTKEVYKGTNLGRWMSNMRSRYRNRKLSADRASALEKIPGWAWSGLRGVTRSAADTWERKYALLRQFTAEWSRLPFARESYKGVSIGKWMSTQKCKRAGLSADRVARLEKIPGWAWATRHTRARTPASEAREKWYQTAALLEEFIGERGRLPHNRESYKGVNLGRWAANQRARRRKLPDYKVAHLEKIPRWVWTIDFETPQCDEAQWHTVCSQLEEFAAENGGPPGTCTTLGAWVESQRRRLRRGELSGLQESRFRRAFCPGPDRSAAGQWWCRLTLLREFAAEKKRTPRDSEFYRDTPLGQWCLKQKSGRRRGGLTREKIALLEGIPGWRW